MTLFTALYEAYEYAKDHDMVDKFDGGNIILPLFHSLKKSNGDDIVEVLLDKNSNLVRAEYLEKEAKIIFPVTIDSVGRTSGVAAHPLIDKFSYLLRVDDKKYSAYREELEGWLAYSQDDFLEIVDKFLQKDDIFRSILGKLYDEYKKIDDLTILVKDDKGKEKKVDFKDVFISFRIEDYDGIKDISYNEKKIYTKII
ncbi:MAG: type I-C CRISPR-associated protein Cas8c/Csd1 [Anaerococcus sp.]|nr:type I-C CRISPR-associated protein Cas8c/Csd1 [Anaerococcus sp.]